MEIRDNDTGKRFSVFSGRAFIDHDQTPEKAKVYMDFRDNLDAGRFQISSESPENHENVPKGMDPETCRSIGVETRLPGFGSVMTYGYEGTEIGDQSKRMTGQGAKLQVNGMKPGEYINIPDTHHGMFYDLPVQEDRSRKPSGVSR